jgi:hypothetical protein
MATKTKNAVDKCEKALQAAQDELRKLVEIKSDQETDLETLQAELVQMETGRGERVLDALIVGDGKNTAWRESTEVADKQAKIDTANAVLTALEGRIKAKERKVVECKANCLVAEADRLDRQVDKRQERTDELLDQLWEWEGVEYVPAMPERGSRPNTRGMKRQFGAIGSVNVGGEDLPSSEYAKHEQYVAAPEVVVVHRPITENLRRKAARYRKSAEALLKDGYANQSGWPDYLK